MAYAIRAMDVFIYGYVRAIDLADTFYSENREPFFLKQNDKLI